MLSSQLEGASSERLWVPRKEGKQPSTPEKAGKKRKTAFISNVLKRLCCWVHPSHNADFPEHVSGSNTSSRLKPEGLFHLFKNRRRLCLSKPALAQPSGYIRLHKHSNDKNPQGMPAVSPGNPLFTVQLLLRGCGSQTGRRSRQQMRRTD